jgi:hypothetical protein
MIQFLPSTDDDLAEIIQWQLADDSKPDVPFGFWLTGSADNPLTCKVCDDLGTVLYLRMDREGSGLRMHTLFTPDSKEGRKRIATMLGDNFLAFAAQMKAFGESITFYSASQSLVNYMMLLGFRPADAPDNYTLMLEPNGTKGREDAIEV